MRYSKKTHTEFTPQQKRTCKQKQQGRCAQCGQPGTEYDHITPLAQGGQSTPGNIQLLCATCHRAKTLKETATARKNHSRLGYYPTESHPGLHHPT